MIIVNNTTKRRGAGGGGWRGGGGLGRRGYCSPFKLVSRVFSYFNMAVAGTAVCWQTKAIYFELETLMSKSRSVWIL